MSTWDIHPSAVQGVLARTADVAGGFESALTGLSSSLEGAAAASSSGPVSTALGAFAATLGSDVDAVLRRTRSAMTGCVDAVNAYEAGDLEMAANAQASASAAPSGEFSGTRPNGPR